MLLTPSPSGDSQNFSSGTLPGNVFWPILNSKSRKKQAAADFDNVVAIEPSLNPNVCSLQDLFNAFKKLSCVQV